MCNVVNIETARVHRDATALIDRVLDIYTSGEDIDTWHAVDCFTPEELDSLLSMLTVYIVGVNEILAEADE